jgi:PIN domain nuclease of toxin-antitoxin system
VAALLLDTHALYWLVRREPMDAAALDAIAAAQDAKALHVSPITAWELGVAMRKRDNRPGLGVDPDAWFRQALRATGAKLATITLAVAAEAAAVPAVYGRGDPGDCFLIATARVRKLVIVTRDDAMLRLAAAQPSYLAAIAC